MAEKLQENYSAAKKEVQTLTKRLEDQTSEFENLQQKAYKLIEESEIKYNDLEQQYRTILEENNNMKNVKTKSGQDVEVLNMKLNKLEEDKKRTEEIAKKAIQQKEELIEKFNCYGDKLQKKQYRSFRIS